LAILTTFYIQFWRFANFLHTILAFCQFFTYNFGDSPTFHL
jgi:hypothetical protein